MEPCAFLLQPMSTSHKDSGLPQDKLGLNGLLYVFCKCKQHQYSEAPQPKDILNNVSFNVGEVILFKETGF